MAASTLFPSPRNILIKEVNWLGDIIMSLPALRAVRHGFPSARLTVLAKRDLASIFDGATWIDEVIPYSVAPGMSGIADRVRIVAEIRRRDFDLAILFPNSFESALWAAMARVPRRVGYATDARRLMLTIHARPGTAAIRSHQAHYWLEMVRATVGIEGDADDFALKVHEPNAEKMRAWLASNRKRNSGKLIALAPGAAFGPAKEWSADHYATLIDLLADRYGAECVMLGAPAECPRCEEIAQRSRTGAIVAAGSTNAGELAALLSLCDGFAGNDSGAMHVSAAVGRPTVGIFGSTNPLRTGPMGASSHALWRHLDCSPCLKRTCRFGHYNCLREISAQDVANSLAELGALG